MDDVRELIPKDGETDDEDDREEDDGDQVVGEILMLPHAPRTRNPSSAGLPRTGELDETLRAPLDAELARRTHVAE
jgi:hypothetical protein